VLMRQPPAMGPYGPWPAPRPSILNIPSTKHPGICPAAQPHPPSSPHRNEAGMFFSFSRIWLAVTDTIPVWKEFEIRNAKFENRENKMDVGNWAVGSRVEPCQRSNLTNKAGIFFGINKKDCDTASIPVWKKMEPGNSKMESGKAALGCAKINPAAIFQFPVSNFQLLFPGGVAPNGDTG
jgi:hypothetical protein